MPRLVLAQECKACGEPSGGRYCPRCISDREQYNGAVLRFRPRTGEDERDGGEIGGKA